MKTTYEENENKDYMSGSKDHYHHLTFKEITQTIQTNMDIPSVFSTGKEPPPMASLEWARSGLFWEWKARSWICLAFYIGQLHDFEKIPYKIETDDGVYIPVPKDGASNIVRAPHRNIISHDIYEETEHIETVKAEIESSFHYSIRVHEIVGQLLRKCTPKLCKRHSMFGGTKSTQTIPTLIAHESFVHCDKTSEVMSWPEHKGTCTIVLKVKALFLIFTSKMSQTDQRRQKMLCASAAMAIRNNMVVRVLIQKYRLSQEDEENLREVFTTAINRTFKDIKS